LHKAKIISEETVRLFFLEKFAFTKWWGISNSDTQSSSIFGLTSGTLSFDFLILQPSQSASVKRCIAPRDSFVISICSEKMHVQTLFEALQAVIEMAFNLSTGFEKTDPVFREWRVYVTKMTKGQVLNNEGVFKCFFEKENACLENENSRESLATVLFNEAKFHQYNDARALIALFFNTLFWGDSKYQKTLLNELEKELRSHENLEDVSKLFLKEIQEILKITSEEEIQKSIQKLQKELFCVGLIEAASGSDEKKCFVGLFEEKKVLKVQLKTNAFILLPWEEDFDFFTICTDNLLKKFPSLFSKNSFSTNLFQQFSFKTSETALSFPSQLLKCHTMGSCYRFSRMETLH
jgi:hypothetical protein